MLENNKKQIELNNVIFQLGIRNVLLNDINKSVKLSSQQKAVFFDVIRYGILSKDKMNYIGLTASKTNNIFCKNIDYVIELIFTESNIEEYCSSINHYFKNIVTPTTRAKLKSIGVNFIDDLAKFKVSNPKELMTCVYGDKKTDSIISRDFEVLFSALNDDDFYKIVCFKKNGERLNAYDSVLELSESEKIPAYDAIYSMNNKNIMRNNICYCRASELEKFKDHRMILASYNDISNNSCKIIDSHGCVFDKMKDAKEENGTTYHSVKKSIDEKVFVSGIAYSYYREELFKDGFPMEVFEEYRR